MPTRKDLKRARRARRSAVSGTAEPKLPVQSDPRFSGGGDEILGEAWELAGLDPDDWSWDPRDPRGKFPTAPDSKQSREFRARYGLDTGALGELREEDHTPDEIHQLPATFEEAKAKAGLELYDPDPDAGRQPSGDISGNDRRDDYDWVLDLFRDPDSLIRPVGEVSRSDVERALRILEETRDYLRDPDPYVGGQASGGGRAGAIETVLNRLLVLFRDPDPNAIARVQDELELSVELLSELRTVARDRDAVDRITARVARKLVGGRSLSLDPTKNSPVVWKEIDEGMREAEWKKLMIVVAVAAFAVVLLAIISVPVSRVDPIVSRRTAIPRRASLAQLIALRLAALREP